MKHTITILLLTTLLLTGCTQTSNVPVTRAEPEKPPGEPTPETERYTRQPEEPILEIDTGGHKAKIQDVIFTADGNYLLSASDDKTVRVWDVSTNSPLEGGQGGVPVRTLRGQIGDGHEGKIYAAALSPDNRLLAVGGMMATFTGSNHEEVGSIRLIDFRSGEVLALLKGHRNVINSLAFSPDSTKLISGSSDKTARIWDVSEKFKPLEKLKGHSDDIYAVAFSPDGKRVVTGSNDDTLKLWNASNGKLLATLKGHTDKVKSAAFTPDGKYLLSGSWDKTIRLWDAKSGTFIKTLATQNARVPSLTISPDGTKVITGCSGGKYVNNVFAIPSGEQITRFSKHDNIVIATAISPDGKTAATGGGNDKAIYLWDLHTGKVKQKLVSKGHTVWSVGFAKDGRSIAWGKTVGNDWNFNNYGMLEQTFQLRGADGTFEPLLGQELQDEQCWIRGIESVNSPLEGGQGGVSIRTKDGDVHPTLEILKNGKVIHEITRTSTDGNYHRSLTLTPDGKTVISGGGNGNLTAYDAKTGKKLHDFIGHTGDVWGVAVSPDGKWLVSGSADQTVKLWDVASGKLLLTIFQGTDDEWVAWLPQGFYTASLNGGRYVGWHVNHGADKAAEYYTAEQYEAIYYRPDIVELALELGDTQEAVAQALKGQQPADLLEARPPKVWFVSPQDGYETDNRQIQVRIKTEDIADPAASVIVKVNSRPLKTKSTGRRTRPTSPDAAVQEFTETVPLVVGDNWIEAEVRGTQGAYQTVMIHVRRKGRQKRLPRLFYFGVGVAQHSNRNLSLDYPDRDVTGLAEVLEAQEGRAFADVKIKVLTDQDATRGNIIDTAETFFQSAKLDDVAVFFVSGHGMNSASGGYHFVAYDTQPERLSSSGVSWEIFNNVLKQIEANVLLLADTCHSGAITGNAAWRKQAEVTPDEFLREANRSGVFVFASSSGTSVSQENPEWGHGAFTKALIDGLTGGAAYKDGVVKISYLQDYVRDAVRKLTEGTQEPRIPQLSGAGEFLNVILAKVE